MISPQRRTDRPPAAGPFPTDALLRRHGFTVVDRQKNRSPVWRRGEHEYSQPEAVTICELEDESKGVVT